MRKTKIICTLGPASDGAGVLEQLMLSGMDCALLPIRAMSCAT